MHWTDLHLHLSLSCAALLSVSDKRGLVPFARGLCDLGLTLIASGGEIL